MTDYPSIPPEYKIDWRDLIFGSGKGICKDCGTDQYTVKELNLADDQADICYNCLDLKRQEEYIDNLCIENFPR